MNKAISIFAVCALAASSVWALEVTVDCESPPAMADFRYHLSKMGATTSTLRVAPHGYRVASEAPEAFRLVVEGEKAYVSGRDAMAVSHGLYELLERMGCDWVMPGELGEVVPENPDPGPEDCDIEESPSFQVRNPWYNGGAACVSQKEYEEFAVWRVRKKMHNFCNHDLFMQGGHMWDEIINRYADVIKEHPEYLALVRNYDGTYERRGPQLDTSNPAVVGLFEDYIRWVFESNKWPKDRAVCLGIGPADGAGFSESPEAKAEGTGRIDPMTGLEDQIDTLVLLCNRILEHIGDEFPNLHLGFYLYSVHAEYPLKYKPNPRISIVIADIFYSRYHSSRDPVPSRIFYRKILEKWASSPVLKFFRGYNWNLFDKCLPFSKLKVWADEYPVYHAMGVEGSTTESEMSWATTGPGNYYEAELLWDVTADMEKTLRKYCDHAFGDGADELYGYYMELTRRQCEAKQEAGGIFATRLIFDRDFVKWAYGRFDAAERKAKKEEEKNRIRHMRFPVEQLDEFFDMQERHFSFDFAGADRTMLRMMDERQKVHDERDHWVSQASVWYMDWYYRRALAKAAVFSQEPYEIVYRIPEELPTVFDPFKRGRDLGFDDGRLNDADFIKTHTYAIPWAAQGLSSMPTGSVWYRIR
ncbi:MAG: DUF4838 domain-containing protein, partial [Kiritimatiellae bacterium]|nr:DUF4838 domain-containing protein [Kiritimatiellia bacterium]